MLGGMTMRGFHLAQLNVGRLRGPLDSAEMAEFKEGLEPINALAEAAPGFVWRLVGDNGADATEVRGADPDLLVNLSVWESRQALWDFVYRSAHLDYLRRRREWFDRMAEPFAVLWWLPAGAIPDVPEAMRRLELLRTYGPGPEAFTFRDPYEPPAPGTRSGQLAGGKAAG